MTKELPEEIRRIINEPPFKGDQAPDPLRSDPISSQPDPIPGRQRFFPGRVGVPDFGLKQEVRGLRDHIDPNDPVTLPGEVTIRRVAPHKNN